MIARFIKYLYLLLFALVPVIFSQYNSELFEVPKIYFIYLVTIFVFALHLYNHLKGNVPIFIKHPVNLFLIIFLASQIASTIFSVDTHTSIFGYYSRLNGGLLSLTIFSLLFVILSVYINDNFRKTIINTSLISGAFVAIYGILQHFGIDKHMWVQDVQNRVFSTLGQPNWLAAYLCILLPLALSRVLFFFENKKFFQFTVHSSLFTLFYLTLLFTKSKTGLTAAALSLALFFVTYFFNNLKSKRNLLLLIANYSLLIVLSLSISNPIKSLVFPQKSTIDDRPSTILITPSEDIRKIVWTGALELWRRFPALGTGPETFAYTYYWTRPVSHNLTSEWDFLYNKAHNEYLNYLAATGTLGFLSYGVLIISILYLFFHNLRSTIYDPAKLAFLACFVSILINNLTGFSVAVTSLYFFLIPALIITDNKIVPPVRSLKSNIIPIVMIVIFTVRFTYDVVTHYFADISYAYASRYEAANNLNDAYEEVTTAIALNSSEPIYHSLYAQILSKKAILASQGKDIEKQKEFTDQAIIETNKAVSISPANLNLLKEKAQVYYYLATLDINHYIKAVESLVKVTRLAPTDAKAFYTLGKFWDAISNDEESLASFNKAIELKPNYDHAYFAAAVIYYEQKDYSKAKEYFDRVLSIAPTNPDAKEYLNKIEAINK